MLYIFKFPFFILILSSTIRENILKEAVEMYQLYTQKKQLLGNI